MKWIKINCTGLMLKDRRSTDPSRLCNYALVPILYISPIYNNFSMKKIFYISPIYSIYFMKSMTLSYANIIVSHNVRIVSLKYIDNKTRRKYDLYMHNQAKYKLLLYIIGFGKCSPNIYSEYTFLHKFGISISWCHCNYDFSKTLSKKLNKNNISKYRTRNE